MITAHDADAGGSARWADKTSSQWQGKKRTEGQRCCRQLGRNRQQLLENKVSLLGDEIKEIQISNQDKIWI